MTNQTLIINNEFLMSRPLSYSSLKHFAKSPIHYMEYLTQPRETTPALTLGKALDCLVFTPDDFQELFVVKPDFGRSKEEKEKYDKWLEENKGKDFITQDMLDTAIAMRDSIMKNPPSRELIDQITKAQQKYYWTDRETGLRQITIPDGEGAGFIMDLKSTTSADPDDFFRTCPDFGYDIQAAMGRDAAKNTRFEFPDYYYIAVEKKAPFACARFKAGKDYLEYGEKRHRLLLQSFKHCMDNNKFHQGYEFRSVLGEFELDLPGWLKSKL